MLVTLLYLFVLSDFQTLLHKNPARQLLLHIKNLQKAYILILIIGRVRCSL